MSDAGTMMRYEALKKSTLIAYLLWWFLGYFGAHRFYMRQTGSAVAMLCLTLAAIPLTLVFVGFFIIAAVFVWWVIDAFLIPGMIESHNLAVAAALSPNG